MTATYRPAPAVAKLAERLIQQHHRHLLGHRVEYVFRSEAQSSGGRIVLGTARKVSGLNALLANLDDGTDDPLFVIEIAEDTWDLLDDRQRTALVDHELCHCTVGETKDGDQVLKIRGHDVEEFRDIVERHGLWKPDLTRFVRSVGAEQLAFMLENPPADPPWLGEPREGDEW